MNGFSEGHKALKASKGDSEAFEKLESYTALKDKLKQEINTLRERVTHFNLPYLSLPSNTPKDVALQVFINMNTNSKPLSPVRHYCRRSRECGRQAPYMTWKNISSANAPRLARYTVMLET